MKTILLFSVLLLLLVITSSYNKAVSKTVNKDTSFTYYINATMDDSIVTFNYEDSAIMTTRYISRTNRILHDFFITGFRSKNNKSSISITAGRKFQPLTVGTYTCAPDYSSNHIFALIDYTQYNNPKYPYGALYGRMPTDSFIDTKVEFTSLDSTAVRGTFSGKLYHIIAYGIDKAHSIIDTLDYHVIKGEFYLPVTNKYVRL
jgi:hypothetical protein